MGGRNLYSYPINTIIWIDPWGLYGLSPSEIKTATSKVGRVDHHPARHLIDDGIITHNAASKAARKQFVDIAKDVLSDPTKHFSHTMVQGGTKVDGFYRQIDGHDIVVFIAKEPIGNKVAIEDIVTAIKPSAHQMANWRLL